MDTPSSAHPGADEAFDTSKPRRVLICGTASSTIGAAPVDDPTVEVWILAWCQSKFARWDRAFEMHDRDWPAACWRSGAVKNYSTILAAMASQGQLYMAPWSIGDDVPGAIEYPLDWAIEKTGIDEHYSSASYMLALAIAETIDPQPGERPVDEILIYGIDMATGTEWDHQYPGCKELIRLAERHGIAVTIPQESSLSRPRRLYGQVHKPAGPITGETLRARINEYGARKDQLIADYHAVDGAKREAEALLELCAVDEAGVPIPGRAKP